MVNFGKLRQNWWKIPKFKCDFLGDFQTHCGVCHNKRAFFSIRLRYCSTFQQRRFSSFFLFYPQVYCSNGRRKHYRSRDGAIAINGPIIDSKTSPSYAPNHAPLFYYPKYKKLAIIPRVETFVFQIKVLLIVQFLFIFAKNQMSHWHLSIVRLLTNYRQRYGLLPSSLPLFFVLQKSPQMHRWKIHYIFE